MAPPPKPYPPVTDGGKPTRSDRRGDGLPDEATLLDYIKTHRVSDVSEVARHFGLKGEARRALRVMLKTLSERGQLDRSGRKQFGAVGALPETGVAEVVERDIDGELWVRWGRPIDTKKLKKFEPPPPPLARLAPLKKGVAATPPGMGDRIYVRFESTDEGWVAHLIKVLDQGAGRIIAVVRTGKKEIRLESVNRKSRESHTVTGTIPENLKDGDVIVAAPVGGPRQYGSSQARILEVIGHEDDPRCASIMAVHAHGLKLGFSSGAELEATGARPPTLEGRTDLRDLPLITIDPEDARDHDDAVYAHADEDPENPGGHVIWVAIADVAAYVREGSSLDREAREKGNSTYFPDRVEPMLPHALSSNLCSLVEGENRACMAVRIVIDAKGRKRSHKFVRGLMRSAAKLSYEQAQAAIDGNPDDKTGPILETLLKPLWAAHAALKIARENRSPLRITSTERRVRLDSEGHVISIEARLSFAAHQLIEDMMIAANVAASEELEKRHIPLIYRVHEAPSVEKLKAFGDFLSTLAIAWTKGEAPRPDRFNAVLDQVKDGPHQDIVNEVVLRTQMQAHYSPERLGHFGLNLDTYAHFTSPIRRYADLTVHRGLIRALKLGDDGLSDPEMKRLSDTADHITQCERRSMAAEREAIDRYVAAFLADRVGANFAGRIVGVTRFGLFVKLDETGADGIIPISSLEGDYYHHDDVRHCLIGQRSGLRWPLGMRVEVKLKEAMPLTGGLVFEVLSDPAPRDDTLPRPRLGVIKRTEFKRGAKPHLPKSKPSGSRHKPGKKKR